MILISPIASGMKFLDENKKNNIGLEKNDVFCNIKKITEVKVPVFIIHGIKDELIPVKHSQEMMKYIKLKFEWFPKNGNHGNILTKYRTKFFIKCNLFLDNLFCFERKETNFTVNSLENSLNFSNIGLYKSSNVNNNNNKNVNSPNIFCKRGSNVLFQNPLNVLNFNMNNNNNFRKSPKYETDLELDLEFSKFNNNNFNIDLNNFTCNFNNNNIDNNHNNNNKEKIPSNIIELNKQNISNIDKLNIEDELDCYPNSDEENFNDNNNNEINNLNKILPSKESTESLKFLEFNENKYLKNSYSLEKSNILMFGRINDNNKDRSSLNSEFNYMKEINDYNDEYQNPFK